MRKMPFRLGVVALLTASALGCGSEDPSAPMSPEDDAASQATRGRAIVVHNSAELVAALSPDNAGRRVLLRAGAYPIDAPLVVPDGMTLEGEGRMRFDGEGLPSGFAAGSQAALIMRANIPGNVVTLGDGAAVRRLQITDLAGRSGNAIAVVSRRAGDRVTATVAEAEILNPNPHGIVPAGPTGCGMAALTLNPGLGLDPPPHEDANITVHMVSSLIRSPSSGIGCGVFVFNFAASGSVSVSLTNNVVGGGIIANGGVSRTDAVHDAKTWLQSFRNLYRDDSPDPCAANHLGWNLTGGSGAPAPLVLPETARNTLRVRSVGDRISGFASGIVGFGGRRFFPAPTAGPTTGNSLVLELVGTRISTPACTGAASVADLTLAGAQVTGASLVPGDGNTVRALFLGVTGSGQRSNVYADVLGPAGPLAPEYQGSGNRLEFVGTLNVFTNTNRRIDPLPGMQFFIGRQFAGASAWSGTE